jgi:hypothetical protein
MIRFAWYESASGSRQGFGRTKARAVTNEGGFVIVVSEALMPADSAADLQ